MNKSRLIDVGYYLTYCGHRVIKGVKQGAISEGKVYFNSEDDFNQYTLPLEAIEFVIPHEEILHEEERNNNESCCKADARLL